jgi:hypothetical protein|tara:strand:+ start:288 stop:1121 length:834 start_codon:yes stop_codon:yes gene_type:complete
MKRYTVITTFNQQGLDKYGQLMIKTFEQYWPNFIDLVVYTENCNPVITKSNVKTIDLIANSKHCKRFIKRHKNNPEANGGLGPHNEHIWKPNKHFKWQGLRFSYKVFSIFHAMQNIDTEWVIWVDADTLTHTHIPNNFLDIVSPVDCVITHLGRGDKYHSECGWVGYNKTNPMCVEFVKDFANMYINDTMFNYPEWHDSYLFDIQRKIYRDTKNAHFHNLNPHPDTKGLAGHPFINSELGKYMDHMKGDRKDLGHSEKKDIKLHTDNPYWRNLPDVR